MTKKDYIQFAKMFGIELKNVRENYFNSTSENQAQENLIYKIMGGAIGIFRSDNSNFDTDKFLEFVNKESNQ